MSKLTIYTDQEPSKPILETTDGVQIADALKEIGVRFERWEAAQQLAEDASDEDVMQAYAHEIERLKRENGYQSVDVIRMLPDNPKRGEFRQKFLSEHTHSEDEVRFFVEGAGIFYLRTGGKVYMTLCEQGDLISVPDGTTHWFDMGPKPFLTCIRLFTSTDGWIANFTGDQIAERFPKFENG